MTIFRPLFSNRERKSRCRTGTSGIPQQDRAAMVASAQEPAESQVDTVTTQDIREPILHPRFRRSGTIVTDPMVPIRQWARMSNDLFYGRSEDVPLFLYIDTIYIHKYIYIQPIDTLYMYTSICMLDICLYIHIYISGRYICIYV